MSVLLIYRRMTSGSFSMERLFRIISSFYPPGLGAREALVPFESRGVLPRVRNILWARRQRADIFHVIGDVHYVTLGLPRSRTVLTVHDCGGVLRAKNRFRREVLRWLWFVIPVRKSAAVVAISENTKRELAKVARFPAKKIRVIPNCIDPRFAWSQHEFDAERPRILQIGQAQNKNIPRLAAALEGISCHLHIVGMIHPETLAALKRHGVDFSNSVGISFEQLQKEYHQADMVAFVSTYEGFGLPILEAQATGRALVTSRLSPMREVAGEGAVLVDPYDVSDIRRGILSIIRDPVLRDSVIRKGRANAERYTPSSIARRYEALYEEIARGAGKGTRC